MATRKSKLRTGILFGVMGIGLVAMVVTGFGTDGMGGMGGAGSTGQRAQSIVDIGDNEITDAELTRLMDMAYRRAVQQEPTLDRETFYARYYDLLLDDLIENRTLATFAEKMGIVVPRSLVDREIVSNPAFLNVAGQYDDTAFRQFLQSQNMTEAQVRSEIETSLLIRMVTGPISGASRTPEAIARDYANLLLETRAGQLGAISTQALSAGIAPSDQEVATFYQQNQRLFQLPERRVLRFALIGREQLGDAVRATDAEIAAYYQENQATYGPSETRNVQIFTTQDEAAARRLADAVRGGTSFVDAARAAGFAAEDVTFPNLRQEQVAQQTSAEVAGQVFGAPQGGLIGPVRTPTGFKVVRIDGVTRNAGRPLEAVRAEIVAAVEQRKMAEAINTRIEQIEERIADGASFEDVAREAGLQVQTTPAMTATGAAPNFQFPQALAPLLNAAFQFEANDDPVVEVVQPDQQVALMQVTNTLAPAAPPLDQIRDQVRARLIQQTALARGRTIAEGIVNRINSGMAPAQAYAQAGISIPAPEPVTARRFQIARAGQQVPPPLTILFAIPEGRARMIPAPNNSGWIVVHHQRRTPGNVQTDPQGSGIAGTMRTQLQETLATEMQSQFANSVRSVVDVERNQERIDALKETLRTGR